MTPAEVADARALTVALFLMPRLGQPYVWGGDGGKELGFDCSGLQCAVLSESDVLYPGLYDGQRRTAAGLLAYYVGRRLVPSADLDKLMPGCLLFYSRRGSAPHHVAMHVARMPLSKGGTPICVEAGGAGSNASTFAGALRASGSVRLSDSDWHGDGIEWGFVDPFALIA